MSLLSKILRIGDHLQLYKSYLYRPIANKEINSLIKSHKNIFTDNYKNGILADALWDHPHHWLRLAMFQIASKDIFGPKISFVVKMQSKKKELLIQLKLFPPKTFLQFQIKLMIG